MLNLFGISVKDAREKVFLSADAKKVLTPKKTMHSATIDGKELSITYRVGKELEQIRDVLDYAQNYPPEESFGFILSGEEIADRTDPERRSDAFMYAKPELDTEKVRTLSMDEKMDRFAWFVSICNRLTDPKLLELIIEQAPKKKDGTFARNRLTVIAAMPVVFFSFMDYYEIVGTAKDATHLQLSIRRRTFSEDEWLRTKSNDFLLFIETGAIPQKPKTVKLWFVHDGKKCAFDVQAVEMENGELAINAKPYRAVSSFSCLSGNDKKGYEIHNPIDVSERMVNCNGKIRKVWSEFSKSSSHEISFAWSRLSDMAGYIRTGKQKYIDGAKDCACCERKNDIPSRCLTENYISEYAYQLLFVLDTINCMVQRPTFPDDVVRVVEKEENPSPYGFSILVPTVPGRKVPIIQASFHVHRYGDDCKVIYQLLYTRADRYTEYEE